MNIVIYSKPDCFRCNVVMSDLHEMNLEYEKHILTTENQIQNLKTQLNKNILHFPIVFVNEKFVEIDELYSLLDEREDFEDVANSSFTTSSSDNLTLSDTPTSDNLDTLEPILKDNPDRLVLLPIEHQDIWDLHKKQESNYWNVNSIDLNHDFDDWNSLDDNKKYFLSHILAFFAASDGIVNENLVLNLANKIQITEARFFYGFQMMMENVHSEVYSKLIDTYIEDKTEKKRLLKAVNPQTEDDAIEFEAIIDKKNWAMKWMNDDDARVAENLIAFACVEGIFFQGSFCAIFWIKEQNLLPGLCQANEYIRRDEGLHCDHAALLYNKIVHKLPEERIHQIVGEAVEIEKKFITESLPVDLIGMNSRLMPQYIELCADFLLQKLGVNKLYNAQNPFTFMEKILLVGKGNMFEKKITDYQKKGDDTGLIETDDF